MEEADVVFTGGRSLYEARRDRREHVYLFPSSVDAAHFGKARSPQDDPQDQRDLPRPRLGFAGVIDERLDTALLAAVADARPDWQLVMVGPVVKIDPAGLPQRPNIAYLGPKPYGDLPRYMAGWDIGMLPFAHNEATRFISPTKTPEYLAGGRPVVSTSIRDVAQPYAELGLVRIADSPSDFVAAVEACLAEPREGALARIDAFLEGSSWDAMWGRMEKILDDVVDGRRSAGAFAGRA
jgi:UDP-galactopyranose mutase